MARVIVEPLAVEEQPRCDYYRVGGSCGHFGCWAVSGSWDTVAACDEHLAEMARAQAHNAPLLRGVSR